MKSNYSFISMIKRYASTSSILIVASVLALFVANSPIKDEYFAFWMQEVKLSIGSFNLFSHNGHPMTLMQVINDFLMAMFFLSVGLEIKREILVGELSTRQKAMLPIIGACGGMLVPVIFFWLLCPNDPNMLRGAAIPMATDIAFSLGVLSIFNTRVPLGLKMFLAALAVADDLGGILVIATFYSTNIECSYLIFAVACTIILILGNKMKVMKKSFYLTVGLALWFAMLNSGVHATIAGVIIAFCVPASQRNGSAYYISRIRENINTFPITNIDSKHNTLILSNSDIHKLKCIESAADKLISPLQELEDSLYKIVGYFVIPIFAFSNVGIDFSSMSLGDIVGGVSLPVMTGLVLGKFIGVFSFSWVAIKYRIVQLPEGCNWKAFASVCMLCGIGLTVSIFIADLSYASLGESGTQLLTQAKVGILCGSLIAAIFGSLMLNRYLPKNK